MITFLEMLQQRVETLIGQANGRPSSILMSGGSTSSLVLHAWARFAPVEIERRAVYLQFDNFNWLERENARTVAKDCGFELVEIALSEKPYLKFSAGRDFDREYFWNTALKSSHVFEAGLLIAGFGWPELICERDAGTDRCSFRESHSFHSTERHNVVSFFDSSKSDEWRAFRAEPDVQLFMTLADEIPFPSIRYWQDFVFQKHFSKFSPCPAWKIEECLGLSR